MPRFPAARRLRLVVLLLLAGLLSAACQTVSALEDQDAIDNAKKRPIIFRAVDGSPPRDISDIRAHLAQAAAKPVNPGASIRLIHLTPP